GRDVLLIAESGIGLDTPPACHGSWATTGEHACTHRPSEARRFALQRTDLAVDLTSGGGELRLRFLRNVTEPGELRAHRIGCGLNRIGRGLHPRSETVYLGADNDAGFNIGHHSLWVYKPPASRLRQAKSLRALSSMDADRRRSSAKSRATGVRPAWTSRALNPGPSRASTVSASDWGRCPRSMKAGG